MIPLLRPTRETYLIKMHSILECPDTLYSTKLPRAEMITAPIKNIQFGADGCKTNTGQPDNYKPKCGRTLNGE